MGVLQTFPKGTSTIETGDLRKFIAGAYDLLNEDWSKFNKRVKAISQEISAGIRNDPEIVLVAAYNSDNSISSDCHAIIKDFLDENNSDSQEVVAFRSFDLKRLLRTIKTVKSGAKSDVEINLIQWGEQNEPYYAIYGKVSCADVAEWHAAHEDLLFSENIRNSLSESDINAQIEAALLRNPTEFWYLNNGITAIADDVFRKPIGLGDQKESAYWKVGNLKIVKERLQQTMGAAAVKSFARYYEVPGYGHAVSMAFNANWDSLKALDQWVVNGAAPVAQQVSDNAGVPGRTRPMCEYPLWPRYKGAGDVNKAESFDCVAE